MKKLFLTMSLLMTGAAQAAPVDLSGWTSDVFSGGGASGGGANWTVQGAASDSVFQNVNGAPTFFYDASANSQGTSLSGTITVETGSDDDFVGFVLGYDANEVNSGAPTDFYLIDWKQGRQPFGGFGVAEEGLALSHVKDPHGFAFWSHDDATSGDVDEIIRGTNLGDLGWNDNQTYTFDLVFTPDLIQVSVDGVLEISATAADFGLTAFDDGSFGFYNYSQSNVRYAGITQDVLPPTTPGGPGGTPGTPPTSVPEPAPLALIALGIAGLVVRRRSKAFNC